MTEDIHSKNLILFINMLMWILVRPAILHVIQSQSIRGQKYQTRNNKIIYYP